VSAKKCDGREMPEIFLHAPTEEFSFSSARSWVDFG
jgi:hypothetical protein